MTGRVGVLMGGRSREREISLRSGRAVLAALRRQGIDAVGIDLTENWPQQIASAGIDRAFIALHGVLGEDGCVQGLLEVMRIPYTGSGVAASAVCMDKRLCKRILDSAGIRVPLDVPLDEAGVPRRFPVVAKPACEGSSIDLRIARTPEEWRPLRDSSGWVIEQFVPGVEVAVGVLDGEALLPVEIVPSSGVYDYEAKYTKGACEYFCPPRLPPETIRRCMEVAEKAVAACGCRGAPRVDLIVPADGEPVVLEINTIPGMTETSLLPKAAAASGMDFDALCLRILQGARLDGEGVR